MKVRYLLACLFVVKHVIPQNAQEINGDILARELNKVADSVGWSFLQNEYNKLRYLETKPNGDRLVKEIAKKIGGRMAEVDIALKRLKEAVVEDQLSSANVPQDCCVDGEYQENVRFRTHVSEETFCYIRPSYVSGDDISFPTTKVLEAMKANLNVKHLQFQYIGLKTGLFINYPSTRLRDCDSYDPRFRPYFVSSTATIPRDVVVVLEISASMRGDKLFEAKHAALTVMETLGVKDRFGLVVFNDEASTLGGCYGNQVVPVTSTTKKSFRDFLNSQQAQKGADYDVALRKAFALLKGNSSVEAKDRDQILLFVSDGRDNSGTEGNPLEVIRDENEAINNNVVINTYGIGTGINSNEKQLLRNMAEQTLNNNSYGHVKTLRPPPCERSWEPTTNTIVYLYQCPRPTHNLTKPYKDFFTNESVITGCLPFALNGVFHGVVCADILISKLVAEILYLKHGEFTYAFIIDGEERTLVHPLLPDPRDVIAQEQDINNIYNFETSGDVSEVIDSMKKGSNGQKPLDTDILETRGQKYLDGDSKRTMKAVFYWAPIGAPGSNFSLCIVMERNNTVSDIENLNNPISGDFVYHRWDLNRWPAPFCRHFSRYATQAKTTVKLTPDAFKEASLYTGVKETGVRVKQLKDYISGDITTNPGLKTSAIKSIRLTYPMEKLWMTTSKEEAPYLVWRYVMTEDGVQRQYPGVRLTDDYDHKLRPWYHRTIAQKTINVVSAPYEDSWGSGKIISLTRSILKGGTNTGGKAEAVIGTDFSIYFFNQMLEDIYPICADRTRYSCILIDNSGFLVMHPYYIETTSPIEGQIYITYLEGRISRSLIKKKNIMYKQPCRDTGNKKEQFTYRVKLEGADLGGIIDSEDGYELRPVSGSNVFLILKTRRSNDEDKCCHSEYHISPSSIPCGTERCSCLCYKDLSFNECRNEYNRTIPRGVPPCSSQLPTLRSVSTPEEDKTRNLPTCFPTDCACRKTERECFRTSGCSWCTSDKNGKLVNGFCDLKEICPSQQCVKDVCSRKSCGPPECKNPPCDEDPNVVIYASASGGAVVIVILIIIVVCIIRKKKTGGHDDTYLDATHEVTIFNKPMSDCIDYNTAPNCYTSTFSVTSEESVNTNAS
ncbi:VWFA and cache domain-containing protein 1 [Magallana gigas]|uniref:VWFA and cache domain-containing protein 1 n=1 Tax=Magallana gigas TaxID=29159 RepID=UPI00333F043C